MGKVAIISGGARGQGEAEARLFVAEGASVVIGDVLDDEGETVASSLGDRCRFAHLDVASEQDWAGAVSAAESFGPLSVLVNNAGIHHTTPIEHETVDVFRRTLEVNLLGTFLGVQAAIEPMRRGGGGSIINISSQAGQQGIAYHGAYGASKWGVRGLSKVAAVELGADGIRVNSVYPGPIETPMMPGVRDGSKPDRRFAKLPLGRAGKAEEVAALVLHLASDESSYESGGEYVIDGGSSAGPRIAYTWTPE